MPKPNPNKIIEKAIKERDVKGLVKLIFNKDLMPGDVDIIRSIVFDLDNRIAITAHTRYGKTYDVAMAVLLWVLFKPHNEVDIVSPVLSQSSKMMEYISENIVESNILRHLVDKRTGNLERLKTEVSRKHITFKNGSRIRILSGAGTGERLMGHGCQLLIVDESCLLNYEVFRTKISRMEEARPGEVSKIVQIGNPWHKGNQFYNAWQDPNYKNIHIGWEQGLKEGRITLAKIEEQRAQLSPLEFKVLYESMFPDTAEDALINFDDILYSIGRTPFEDGEPVWGLDVADTGLNKTILSEGLRDGDLKRLYRQIEINESDPMKIVKTVMKYVPKDEPLYIDTIGVGSGTYSRLKELGYNVISVRVSRSPMPDEIKRLNKRSKEYKEEKEKADRFLNQKSLFYWRLRELFGNKKLYLPEHIGKLQTQLANFRWEINTTGKIKIIDPQGPSPDYASSFMLMCCDYVEEKPTLFFAHG